MENVVAARRQKLVSYRVSIRRMWRNEVFMSRLGDIRMVEERRLPRTKFGKFNAYLYVDMLQAFCLSKLIVSTFRDRKLLKRKAER